MRKSKFSESQIVSILKDAEGGIAVADLLRKHGISKATFFKWRSKYGGASVSDVKRLRELEVATDGKLRQQPCTSRRTHGRRARPIRKQRPQGRGERGGIAGFE